jgi:PAS domain S-box-containing protein
MAIRFNSAEVENLYQDILINVTSFFRDPEAFEVLKEKIFPRLIERRTPDEPLRIWVMGCSTGEEAYSIAMAFTEFSCERSGHIPVQIFATDINEKSIEKARAGLYSKDITADVSPERLRRFFTEADGGYRVSKPLRDMCVFARQNVAADPPFSRMDLISCRNLLIYLESALQKQILPLIHYALKPTGILWLGSSETAGAAPDLFEPEDKRHRFYARKPTTKLPRLGYLTGAEARKMDIAPSAVEFVGPTAASIEKEAQREADRIILARYAPASALINEELIILQLRGDTSPYLEQSHGKATGNLMKLAREDLLVALRAAVDEARKDGSPVRKQNLRVRHNDVTSSVNLEVIPIKHPLSRETTSRSHEFQTIGRRTMLLNARRLDTPEGDPERILLGIDDMTERLGAAALRESEERFRTLADNAPALIWVTSSTGAKFVNREYLEFLGVDEAEVLGDKWAKFIHPEDREAYVNAFLEATSNRIRFEAELRFRRRDGEYRWMHSVGMARFEGGEFNGYVGSTFDIHDRKFAVSLGIYAS